MSIRELGYLLFGSKDLQGWKTFSETIVGFAASDAPDGALYLKMDERDFRLAILPDDSERLIASGWEVGSQDEFVELRALLKDSGTQILDGTAKQARLRRVQEFFSFSDPSANVIEVFWGPISDFKPFRSPAGMSSFITGGLGLGHVVVPAADIEATQAFWSKTLGFNLSDILHLNFGGQDVKLYFNHCGNGRQHSLALAGMPSSNGCIHFMVEVPTLKDVGKALDRVQDAGLPLVMTLGQHVNDDCVSFYFQSPHGYMVEIGCDAVIKDWDRHSVFETTLPSHWGHRFVLNRQGMDREQGGARYATGVQLAVRACRGQPPAGEELDQAAQLNQQLLELDPRRLSQVSVYSMTKTAFANMPMFLAQELGTRGITANTVVPGIVETDMSRP